MSQKIDIIVRVVVMPGFALQVAQGVNELFQASQTKTTRLLEFCDDVGSIALHG